MPNLSHPRAWPGFGRKAASGAGISLRQRLISRLGLVMLGFAAACSLAVYHLSLRYSDEVYDEWLLDSARSLTFLVHGSPGNVKVELPDSTLHAMVWDAQDLVLFRIDSQRNGFIAGQREMVSLTRQPRSTLVYDDLTVNGQPMRVVRITRGDLIAKDMITVTVGETLHKRHRLASRVLVTVMAVSVALAALAVLMARNAVERGLRPLQGLTEAIRRRPAHGLQRLPQEDLPSELKTFAQALNALLDQLDAASRWQRRFVADAAHQLRTPLAALKVEVDHAMREPDPQAHQLALQQLKAGIDRLSHVTTQLLTLARSETGALSSLNFTTLDLCELAKLAAQRQIGQALAADIDLGFEGPAAAWVQGDALLLEQAVVNLVDNAIRYSGAKSSVTLSVHARPGQVQLCVEDNGRGVDPQELPRLTERFHRAAGSPGEGSGLGLAIVQEIAHLHDGSMALRLISPHGLRVELCLPAAAHAVQPVHN